MNERPEIQCPLCGRVRVQRQCNFIWKAKPSGEPVDPHQDVEHKLCPQCTEQRHAEARKGQEVECRPVISPSLTEARMKGSRFIPAIKTTQPDWFDGSASPGDLSKGDRNPCGSILAATNVEVGDLADSEGDDGQCCGVDILATVVTTTTLSEKDLFRNQSRRIIVRSGRGADGLFTAIMDDAASAYEQMCGICESIESSCDNEEIADGQQFYMNALEAHLLKLRADPETPFFGDWHDMLMRAQGAVASVCDCNESDIRGLNPEKKPPSLPWSSVSRISISPPLPLPAFCKLLLRDYVCGFHIQRVEVEHRTEWDHSGAELLGVVHYLAFTSWSKRETTLGGMFAWIQEKFNERGR